MTRQQHFYEMLQFYCADNAIAIKASRLSSVPKQLLGGLQQIHSLRQVNESKAWLDWFLQFADRNSLDESDSFALLDVLCMFFAC